MDVRVSRQIARLNLLFLHSLLLLDLLLVLINDPFEYE